MRTRPFSLVWLTVVFAGVMLPSLASAQLLRRASGAVNRGSSNSSSNSSSSSSSSSSASSSGRGDGRSSGFGRRFRYLRYPYAYGSVGYAVPLEQTTEQETNVRFLGSVEGGLIVPNVGRGGVNARLLFSVFDLDVRYSFYVEPGATEVSEAALGRWDFGVHLVEAPTGQVRLHGGFVHWADVQGHNLGFSGGLGIEHFPNDPFVLSLDVGGGSVGFAGMLYARGTVGLLVRNVEFQLGWDHVTLTTQDSSSWVHLTGPFAGVRLWL